MTLNVCRQRCDIIYVLRRALCLQLGNGLWWGIRLEAGSLGTMLSSYRQRGDHPKEGAVNGNGKM